MSTGSVGGIAKLSVMQNADGSLESTGGLKGRVVKLLKSIGFFKSTNFLEGEKALNAINARISYGVGQIIKGEAKLAVNAGELKNLHSILTSKDFEGNKSVSDAAQNIFALGTAVKTENAETAKRLAIPQLARTFADELLAATTPEDKARVKEGQDKLISQYGSSADEVRQKRDKFVARLQLPSAQAFFEAGRTVKIPTAPTPEPK